MSVPGGRLSQRHRAAGQCSRDDLRPPAVTTMTLFSPHRRLFDLLRDRRAAVRDAVARISFGQLDKPQKVERLIVELDAQFRVVPPELDLDRAVQDPVRERVVHTEHWSGRTVRHTRLARTFVVPIIGSAEVLAVRPDRWEGCAINGSVGNQTLRIVVDLPAEASGEQISSALMGEVDRVRRHVDWGAQQVVDFNSWLDENLRPLVENRRDLLAAAQAATGAVGIPVQAGPSAASRALSRSTSRVRSSASRVMTHEWWNSRTGVMTLISVIVAIVGLGIAWFAWQQPQVPTPSSPGVTTSQNAGASVSPSPSASSTPSPTRSPAPPTPSISSP